jgi:hypothetical protein
MRGAYAEAVKFQILNVKGPLGGARIQIAGLARVSLKNFHLRDS